MGAELVHDAVDLVSVLDDDADEVLLDDEAVLDAATLGEAVPDGVVLEGDARVADVRWAVDAEVEVAGALDVVVVAALVLEAMVAWVPAPLASRFSASAVPWQPTTSTVKAAINSMHSSLAIGTHLDFLFPSIRPDRTGSAQCSRDAATAWTSFQRMTRAPARGHRSTSYRPRST
jgi:hypothetical protein